MPSGKSWMCFVYINIAFAVFVAAIFYYNQVAIINANWPQYRCNPVYMPLADNIEENFTYCIQNMQSSFMGYLLQPLNFITGSLGSTMGNVMTEINSIRAMFDKIRTFFTEAIQSVFGVFLNLIIEFQKITIGIKDLMGKTVGIMASLMFILDGSIQTMNSTWSGPPGQMVKALGKCFHPDTEIQLKNGTTRKICELRLGDRLQDGSYVDATMMIDNRREPETIYKIQSTSQDTAIYVTGSHLVLHRKSGKFIPVKNYERANPTTLKSDVLCCLITNSHKIPIGEEIFWDWEDHFLK